jgi:hypothetical protein
MARYSKRRLDAFQQQREIPTQVGSKREYIRQFNSLGELLTYAKEGNYITTDVSWAGGLTKNSAINRTREGNIVKQDTLRKAEALLDKIDASFRDRDVHSWQPSIAGAYPIVPEWLMGRFDAMRIKHPEESEIAPIKMYIECAVSAGVSHDALIKRGTAIAALLMRMTEHRPVELYMFAAWDLTTCDMHKCLWSARMDTSPTSLNQLLHVMGEPAFLRMINFNVSDRLARENGDRIRWGMESLAWAYSTSSYTSNDAGRERALRQRFELEPQDVVMQRGYLPDEAQMNNDPVAWVHTQLEKQRAITED